MNIIDATKIIENGGTICKIGRPEVKIKCAEMDGEKIIYSEGGTVTADILGLLSTDFIGVESVENVETTEKESKE